MVFCLSSFNENVTYCTQTQGLALTILSVRSSQNGGRPAVDPQVFMDMSKAMLVLQGLAFGFFVIGQGVKVRERGSMGSTGVKNSKEKMLPHQKFPLPSPFPSHKTFPPLSTRST
jgi:hypothetical protein